MKLFYTDHIDCPDDHIPLTGDMVMNKNGGDRIIITRGGIHFFMPEVAEYGDEDLHVHFYQQAVHNESSSLNDGLARYDDVTFVRIILPGQKHTIIDRPASKNDIKRFDQQYQDFMQKLGQQNT